MSPKSNSLFGLYGLYTEKQTIRKLLPSTPGQS